MIEAIEAAEAAEAAEAFMPHEDSRSGFLAGCVMQDALARAVAQA
jgi:hypothetical protein